MSFIKKHLLPLWILSVLIKVTLAKLINFILHLTTKQSNTSPPTQNGGWTIEWLTLVLQDQNLITQDQFVSEFVNKNVGEGTGTTANTVLVEATIEGKRNDVEKVSVVIKSVGNSFFESLVCMLANLNNEVLFYEHFGEDFVIKVPKYLYGHQKNWGSEMLFVMEHIKGEWIDSTCWEEDDDLIPYEKVIEATRNLALMHAKYWSRNLNKTYPWMTQISETISMTFKANTRTFISRFRDILPPEFQDLENFESLGPLIQSLIDYFSHRYQNTTLTHGDYRFGNMIWHKEEGLVVYDWQLISDTCGISDLAYFLCVDFPTQFRREHEFEIIDIYIESLIENGVPPEDCERDTMHELYQIFILLRPMLVAFAAYNSRKKTNTQERLENVMLTRVVNAVQDHNSVVLARNYLETVQ